MTDRHATPLNAPAAQRLLVYGLGRSGTAVVQRALGGDANSANAVDSGATGAGTPGPETPGGGSQSTGTSLGPSGVWFYEARQDGPDVQQALEAGAIRVNNVADWLTHGTTNDLVVAAPGVPIDHPDLNTLRAGGAEVIGEVEWVYRQVPGRYIGITGTAGKGSVTRWCGDTLTSAGADVVVGGNIVPALAAVACPGAIHVVEMSSFQLERVPTFAPDVAVVLNLGEDHIDRHGSVAAYHLAKKNLLANLGPNNTFVANADDPLVRAWADQAQSRGVNVLRFSIQTPVPGARDAADAYLDPTGNLVVQGTALVNRANLKVRGDHQVANALAMALACQAVGATNEQLIEGLTSFTGLPGRYSPAGSVGQVQFIEDSIATRPLAVEAAIKATPRPLVWLAGGQAKGSSLGELAPLVAEHVDLVLAFGESGAQFAQAFEQHAPTERINEPTGPQTMQALVNRAVEYLQHRHGGQGNVLLAPLAASFDQFADYQQRAEAFRQAVAQAQEAQDAQNATPNGRQNHATASTGRAT